MRRRFDFALCALCGTPTDATASKCPACGGSPLFLVENGYVLEFPAQTIPCPRCGSAAQPVRFRGWAELLAVIWWVREGRLSAYLCPDCARRQTIKSLLFTTVLGWWSIPSWFFHGWRGTYINWRAVFAAPARPHEWGALSGEDFAEILADMRSDEELDADEEWIVDEPALRDLSPAQLELVLSAERLYELLGISRAQQRTSCDGRTGSAAKNCTPICTRAQGMRPRTWSASTGHGRSCELIRCGRHTTGSKRIAARRRHEPGPARARDGPVALAGGRHRVGGCLELVERDVRERLRVLWQHRGASPVSGIDTCQSSNGSQLRPSQAPRRSPRRSPGRSQDKSVATRDLRRSSRLSGRAVAGRLKGWRRDTLAAGSKLSHNALTLAMREADIATAVVRFAEAPTQARLASVNATIDSYNRLTR